MRWRALLMTAIAAAAVYGVVSLVADLAGDDDDAPESPGAPIAGAQEGRLGERVGEIYARSRNSVVFIQARVVGEGQSPFGPPSRGGVATGSGFLYDDEGHVVTNAHVVENAVEVTVEDGSGPVPARLVGTDLSTDLAVLKVDRDGIEGEPLALGRSRQLEVGDPVIAIGNPLGLEDTVTTGIVSALQRRLTAPNGFTIEDVIQSDAAINPGNSGGPLLDARGRVVGVNSQIATAGSRGFIGIGFAVPSATVREVVPTLIEDGEVSRPYLGVTSVQLGDQLADRLGLTVDSGALVVAVAPRSPAARAGIRAGSGGPLGVLRPGGDVIVEFGGERIEGPDDLAAAVADSAIGETVRVEVVGGAQRRTLTVEIGDRPG